MRARFTVIRILTSWDKYVSHPRRTVKLTHGAHFYPDAARHDPASTKRGTGRPDGGKDVQIEMGVIEMRLRTCARANGNVCNAEDDTEPTMIGVVPTHV